MIDRENVIKGLEICFEHGSWHGLDCEHNGAYKDCPYRGCETGCVVTIAKDALALLKEQPDIVRCKDCKHAVLTSKGEVKYCQFWQEDEDGNFGGDPLYLDGDFFCAGGERRERND